MNPALPALLVAFLRGAMPVSVAVVPVDVGAGVDQAVAPRIEALLSQLLRDRHARVIDAPKVRARLGAERVWRLWRCPDAACLRAGGAALPADALLVASVSLIGANMALEMQFLRLRGPPRAAVAMRSARVDLARSLHEATASAMNELWPAPRPAPAGALAKPPPSILAVPRHAAPWWLAGGGLIVAVLGAGLVDYALGESHPVTQQGVTRYTYTWAQARLANTEGTAGEAVFALGVAAGIGGLAWGLAQ